MRDDNLCVPRPRHIPGSQTDLKGFRQGNIRGDHVTLSNQPLNLIHRPLLLRVVLVNADIFVEVQRRRVDFLNDDTVARTSNPCR